jgi:TRAP-type uncharacterized transport system fused permease subunit
LQTATRRSPAISIICLILAIVSAVATIFYWTQSTSLLAGTNGIHHKHAAVFAILTILFLLGAILFRPQRATLR